MTRLFRHCGELLPLFLVGTLVGCSSGGFRRAGEVRAVRAEYAEEAAEAAELEAAEPLSPT
ncbi:hypothetical protein [Actinopolyspora saharensis]|uniref:hypothetical protein n=1 Tax=Actinopolyspora saharensis TaxID=995062 RepID=UPI003F67B535